MSVTTKMELSEWFDRGIKKGATHMIVVCDTYDWEDYPVYVESGQDVSTVEAGYDGKNMAKVMEIYDLSMDKDQQMAQHRAYNK